jgi:hypothetical protein
MDVQHGYATWVPHEKKSNRHSPDTGRRQRQCIEGQQHEPREGPWQLVQRPQPQHIEGVQYLQAKNSQRQQDPSVSHLASISQIVGGDGDVVEIPTPILFAQQPIEGEVGNSYITQRQPCVLSANDDDVHIVDELNKLSSEWEACSRRYIMN